MAVYDRWHRRPRPGDKPCRCSRGKTPLYPSAAHQQGDRWQVRWYDDAGRQRSRNFPVREGRDPARHAGAFDAKIRHELDAGTYADPSAALVTFREYAEQWRALRLVDDVSAAKYEAGFRNHVYPAIGNVPLHRLSRAPTLTASWVKGLEGRLSPVTIRNLLTIVSGVYAAAMQDGLIARNPLKASGMARPALPPGKARAWTAERVRAMSAALPERYAVIPLLGAGTGMRQGELFALALEDITFLGRDPHISVTRQLKYVAERPCFSLPKKYKTREIPLAPEVAEALAEHMRRFPPVLVTLPWHEPRNRQRHGKPVTARLVLTGTRGGVLNRKNFNVSAWHPAQEACGITPPRPDGGKRAPAREEGMHALRHTFASVQLAAGAAPSDVAAWLGDSVAVLLETYAHYMPGNEGRGRAAVSAFLGGTDARNVPPGREGRALCPVNATRRLNPCFLPGLPVRALRPFRPAGTPAAGCRGLSRSAGAHVPPMCPARPWPSSPTCTRRAPPPMTGRWCATTRRG